MAHLLNIWPSVARRLRNAGRVLLLFDYDGTLTPIVARPELARLAPAVREALARLASGGDGGGKFIVGLVSGRSLADLRALLAVPGPAAAPGMPSAEPGASDVRGPAAAPGRPDIPGLLLAGNHGFEISGPGIEFVHPEAAALRPALDDAFARLQAAAAATPGAMVEHKGLSLTAHYRGVAPEQAGGLERAVEAAVAPLVESGQLRITRGKMVREIRPNLPWHKGRAIAWLHSRYPEAPLPVYFGDDVTDEDGFIAAQELGGLAVFVGPPRDGTNALHQLDSPQEVAQTLQLLLELQGPGGGV